MFDVWEEKSYLCECIGEKKGREGVFVCVCGSVSGKLKFVCVYLCVSVCICAHGVYVCLCVFISIRGLYLSVSIPECEQEKMISKLRGEIKV